MRRTQARKLSYANVMATVAVFVALGGSSYAAVQITGQNVKNNTISSADVKNRSLAGKDFKPGLLKAGARGPAGAQGPSGAQGPQGQQGAAGANGATNVVMRKSAPVTVNGGADFQSATASCLAGERATGGGAYQVSNVLQVQVTASYPTPNPFVGPSTGNGQVPTGWRVWVRNDGAAGDNYNFEAYVICASP